MLGTLADRHGHWRMLIVGAWVEALLWPLPALAHGLIAFAIAWALVNGVASGVFALSFSVLADSAASEVRGRVMSFAYLPVNVGFMVGPAIGSIITRSNIFAVFPLAALLTVLGIIALTLAQRRAVAPAIQMA